MSGHYGELIFGQKRKIDILFSPMIRTLPSFMIGHVVDSLACPRVMAGPENIKAGFIKCAADEPGRRAGGVEGSLRCLHRAGSNTVSTL